MRIVYVVAMTVLLPCVTHARTVPVWEIERLFEESDLVVLAYPTAVNPRTELDGVFVDRSDRDFLTTTETQFKIILRLKGKVPAGQLGVLHYELKEDARVPDNGPNLPRFTSKIVLPRFADRSKLEDSTFMLFLRRNKNGTVEFVTGRYDSVFSVKQLRDVAGDERHLQFPLPTE